MKTREQLCNKIYTYFTIRAKDLLPIHVDVIDQMRKEIEDIIKHHIILCEECKYASLEKSGDTIKVNCAFTNHSGMMPNDYCNFAERRQYNG